MTKFLLMDFGASRVKTAIADLVSDELCMFRDFPTLHNIASGAGRYEISLRGLREQFFMICSLYWEEMTEKFTDIFLSSQMHGFVLLNENNEPLTEYVSWRDERSLEVIEGQSTYDMLNGAIGEKFKRITGLRARASFPFFNLGYVIRTQGITKARVITLPDYLAMTSDDFLSVSHPTMLAGLGFYDLQKRTISGDLIGIYKDLWKTDLIFNEGREIQEVAGYWQSSSQKIPIYVGVGDHQCAVLGAGNKPRQTISVNIGTGSQVSIIDYDVESAEVDHRPFFEGEELSTITHIPAGRVLVEYIGSTSKIFDFDANDTKLIWKKLKLLSAEQVLCSNLQIDLAIFPGAYGYRQGGGMTSIPKGNFSLEDFLSSLIRSLALQYKQAIQTIDPEKKSKTIILSGGIPRQLPFLVPVLKFLTDREVKIPASTDETLLGLKMLAEKISK